ncbi:Pr6Pr family membrane protein [Streptomyces chryseus]|uniref:Integral membrane protein n=1 Tax=Streptomyces chryseus TaxID=68186 RepID=A0ABQ3DUG1_9ACTN|nr:Pr6Pr family membrane protein [Streptomyces chryseus]GHB10245.1 hypothetical protein GCM10010346_36770 [Streptomyces chryseus]
MSPRPQSSRRAGGVLLLVSITGLVYHLVLANSSSGFSMTGDATHALTGRRSVSNQFLHTVTPLAAALDWLVLTAPGGLLVRHAAQWMLCPPVYLLFALACGALLSPGSEARYPYPFVDVEAHGYAGVVGDAVFFGAAFYALGLAIVGLDRIRPSLGPDLRHRSNRISPPAVSPLK